MKMSPFYAEGDKEMDSLRFETFTSSQFNLVRVHNDYKLKEWLMLGIIR